MRGVAAGILVTAVYAAPLPAQEQNRSLERINVALQQPAPIVRSVATVDHDPRMTLGIFTLVEPQLRGEIVRISVPIGELAMKAIKGVATANQQRREHAARRRVEQALRTRRE